MPKSILQELIRQHNLHAGVYSRVAARLGVDPSYVSKVANGERDSVAIQEALIEELQKITNLR